MDDVRYSKKAQIIELLHLRNQIWAGICNYEKTEENLDLTIYRALRIIIDEGC